MSKISANSEELTEIIDQMEKSKRSFEALGCSLEAAMINDELEIYGEAESILAQSISHLRQLAVR